ncbi:MAG: polymerase [Kosmotogales bacterium]|nr:polymerase [Kosmotogales bacterium]
MSKLFLFDGTALFYRAFYGIDMRLRNSEGNPTNALYGVARMLNLFLKQWVKESDGCVFAFDRKEKTHRHKLYKEYKGTRKPMPDDLVKQLPYIEELVESFGIRFFSFQTLEADDIIATLSRRYYENFDKVLIVSNDKDLTQLVDERINVLRFMKGISNLELEDREKIKERVGVYPEKVGELLSISGDASDNIPGIKGIGLKTAQKLLNEYSSIEGIYKNIRELTPKQRQKFIDCRPDLELSEKLVKLVEDSDFDLELSEIIYSGVNKELMKKVFTRFEFTSLLEEYGLDKIEKKEREEKNYTLIKNEIEYENLIDELKERKEFAFDLETTSLDPISAEIVGISFSYEEDNGFYIPVLHRGEGWQIDGDELIEDLKKLFSDKSLKLYGQNLKYDYSVLDKYEIYPPVPQGDSMIAAYLLEPDSKKFNMDYLANNYLSYSTVKFEDLMKEHDLKEDFRGVPIEEAAFYGAEDSDISLILCNYFKKKIEKLEMEKLYEDIELALIPVLVNMELNGVYIDTEILEELKEKYDEISQKILSKIFELAGREFNPNSPSQVSNILFGDLGINPPKKTKSGGYSTSASILEKIKDEHEIIREILNYRKHQKLISTYLVALPKLVNSVTGRIHSSYNQTGTGTGRLSSHHPNMQNLPIREEEGREIRKAIKPQKKGWKIVSADYSQIELRILAHISGDKNLIDAFNNNKDIHRMTAAKLFGVTEDDVSYEMRRVGKMVNFSIIYGISPYGLSNRIDVSRKEAKRMIDSYFSAYPKVEEFMQSVKDRSKKDKYVKTLFNRRRYIPQLSSKNKNIFQEGERIAINTPIQGTAADIIKLAMIKIHDEIKKNSLKSLMIMQVHDELVFECPEDEIEEMLEIIERGMSEVIRMKVPLKIDVETGDCWC